MNNNIKRVLPNDEYQAALNADNPSASNPFLTENDLAGGIGGGLNIPITSFASNGNAPSGIILSPSLNQLEYEVTGVGLATGKNTYYQFVVPQGYSGGGGIQVVVSTSQAIPIWAVTGIVNNVADVTINNQDINTAVTYPVFEIQTYTFGTTLAPGDIVTLVFAFLGGNNQDAYIKGVSFNYNIDIL